MPPGRPKSRNPKVKQLHIRLNSFEADQISFLKEAGYNVSEICRDAIEDAYQIEKRKKL